MMVNLVFEIITILCLISKTNAFKCWVCSSDESDTAFCGKVLDESNLTHSQKLVNLVQCSYPHFDLMKGRNLITKCMIQKTISNGIFVYSRSCGWEETYAEKDACLSHSPPYGHQIVTCDTCVEDKCNYMLTSDIHDTSTYATAFYHLVFICLGLILII